MYFLTLKNIDGINSLIILIEKILRQGAEEYWPDTDPWI